MDIKEKLRKEAQRIEEDSLYSSKGHFNAASFWSNFHLGIGIPTAILAAIAGVSAFSQFDNHNIVAGFISLLVAALSALTTFLNPNEKANAHLNSGNEYNALRNNARLFYEIALETANDERSLLHELSKMNEKRSELNSKSPQIPKRAFEKARNGIKEGEAKYKADHYT